MPARTFRSRQLSSNFKQINRMPPETSYTTNLDYFTTELAQRLQLVVDAVGILAPVYYRFSSIQLVRKTAGSYLVELTRMRHRRINTYEDTNTFASEWIELGNLLVRTQVLVVALGIDAFQRAGSLNGPHKAYFEHLLYSINNWMIGESSLSDKQRNADNLLKAGDPTFVPITENVDGKENKESPMERLGQMCKLLRITTKNAKQALQPNAHLDVSVLKEHAKVFLTNLTISLLDLNIICDQLKYGNFSAGGVFVKILMSVLLLWVAKKSLDIVQPYTFAQVKYSTYIVNTLLLLGAYYYKFVLKHSEKLLFAANLATAGLALSAAFTWLVNKLGYTYTPSLSIYHHGSGPGWFSPTSSPEASSNWGIGMSIGAGLSVLSAAALGYAWYKSGSSSSLPAPRKLSRSTSHPNPTMRSSSRSRSNLTLPPRRSSAM